MEFIRGRRVDEAVTSGRNKFLFSVVAINAAREDDDLSPGFFVIISGSKFLLLLLFFFLVVNERSLEKFRAIFFGEILGGGEFNESGNEYKFEAIDVAFRIHKLNRESSWRMLAR